MKFAKGKSMVIIMYKFTNEVNNIGIDYCGSDIRY